MRIKQKYLLLARMISTNKIEVEDKTEIKKGEIVLFYFEENNERNQDQILNYIIEL